MPDTAYTCPVTFELPWRDAERCPARHQTGAPGRPKSTPIYALVAWLRSSAPASGRGRPLRSPRAHDPHGVRSHTESGRSRQTGTRRRSARMNPNKALWEKGDFTRIAQSMRESGEAVVERLGVKAEMKVLD